MEYQIGDIIKLKKPHPCGSQEWEILRVGADFRLKCMGCGHQVMVSRKLVEKNTRGIRKACSLLLFRATFVFTNTFATHSQNLHFLLAFQQEIW